MADNTRWLSVAEARERIFAGIQPVREQETVPLPQALMRVLAADAHAPFNVPGHDNSAMDGFACRLADVCGADAELSVKGSAFAGHPYQGGAIADGECVKIMTGAQLPPGGEIIIPQEETEAAADGAALIRARAGRQAGQHIRLAGEDLKAGEVALARGALCYPAHIGLLASLGLETVSVMRQLRVAFFSTGDEVRAAGDRLGSSDVYDSNRHTLRAMIQRAGACAIDCGIVPDDRARLAAVMDKASAEADVVIASGGASVGEADYIRSALAERGSVLFWKVAMRPGRPLAYGKVGGADFFGLPGNPVSVMVCFYQFVREALHRRAGRQGDCAVPLMPAMTATDLRKAPGRTEYQRAVLAQDAQGRNIVTVTGDQGSGILSSMARANCFIVLPAECGPIKKGDMVNVQLFESLL